MPTDNNVPSPTGYAGRVVTKAPEWYGLVSFEVLINNLATGLFLVAAVAELAAPPHFTAVAARAYAIALALLLTDLALLILDLGDPLRFHHMLRVFKPTSPMSLGVWCLTVYSFVLTAIVAGDVVAAVGWMAADLLVVSWARQVLIIAGLPLAFASAVYKGVLFSTTAQPGWKDARWLGGYFVNSAIFLGSGALLALSILTGQERAAAILRPALLLLLLLNVAAMGQLLIDVRATVSAAYTRTALGRLGVLVIGGGVLLPLSLLAADGPVPTLAAVLFILLGALVVRFELVRFPHLAARPRPTLFGR